MSKAETSRLRVLIIVAAVALVGLIVVRVVMAHRSPEEKLADQWLEAVQTGDQKTALEIANKLVPEGHDKIVHPAYVGLFTHEKLPTSFLTDSFNSHDVRAWSEAAFFHKIATGKTIQQLFNITTGQIKPVEPKAVNGWPLEIWLRRFGLCDRMCWVMSELAYQQGSETCMVYLKDAKTRASPHTVVEVRSGPKVWLADPLKGVIGHGRGVERIANDPGAVKQMWPNNQYWQECLKHSILYTPSAPTDYCNRNQQLRKVLQELLGSRCPRFGEDPRERLVRVNALREREMGKSNRCSMIIWNHPLRLLYRDMLQTGEIKPVNGAKATPTEKTPETK